MARRIELVSGLAAGALGLALLVYVLFGPTYASESSSISIGADGAATQTTVRDSASLLEMGVHPATWAFLGVVLLVVLSASGGATVHALFGMRAGLVVLWISAALLVLAGFLSILSVGLFILPVALLALVAALAASVYDADELRR